LLLPESRPAYAMDAEYTITIPIAIRTIAENKTLLSNLIVLLFG
jgi:hypothetical protein